MLGRLFKYEMKATARILIPIYAAMLVIAGISRISLNIKIEESSPFSFLNDINAIVFFISVVAVLIITEIVIIWRFYRAVSSDEGYLLFTLPVKTDSIILSELLCAFIWSIALSVIIIVSSFIMMINMNIDGAVLNFSYIWEIILKISPQGWCGIAVIFGNLILSCIAEIICIYCAISIASLFRKHKIIFSVVFYIAMVLVVNIFDACIIGIFTGNNVETVVNIDDAESFVDIFNNYILPSMLGIENIIDIAVTLCAIIVQYSVIRFILKKHLNVE